MSSNLVDWLLENEPSFRKSRLPSLYADLAQQRASNPDGFIANATAWQNALIRAALAGQLPTEQKIILQSSGQLLEALRSPQYGQPSGLGVVIDEAVRSGRMVDVKMFIEAEHSIYEKSRLPNPWALLTWGLRQIGLIANNSWEQSGRLRNGQLVLIDGLEVVAKQLMAQHAQLGQSITDRVMSRNTFIQKVSETEVGALSSYEIELLLQYLSRDKEALIYDATTVKFRTKSTTSGETITQEDRSIASIKSLIASLEAQVSELTARVASLQKSAQTAIEAKNRHGALSAIRSRKLAEKALQTRSDTLHQLEEVYTRIEHAIGQVQIVEVMQSSADTLRSLNKRIGGAERVDAVMDDLREQMGQVDEVGQVISEPLDGKAVIDETEIDDELEAMEKEELKKREEMDAEATRLKLAELEKASTSQLSTETAQQKSEKDTQLESELEGSSQKLAKIHLEEDTATKDPQGDPLQLEPV